VSKPRIIDRRKGTALYAVEERRKGSHQAWEVMRRLCHTEESAVAHAKSLTNIATNYEYRPVRIR